MFFSNLSYFKITIKAEWRILAQRSSQLVEGVGGTHQNCQTPSEFSPTLHTFTLLTTHPLLPEMMWTTDISWKLDKLRGFIIQEQEEESWSVSHIGCALGTEH